MTGLEFAVNISYKVFYYQSFIYACIYFYIEHDDVTLICSFLSDTAHMYTMYSHVDMSDDQNEIL